MLWCFHYEVYWDFLILLDMVEQLIVHCNHWPFTMHSLSDSNCQHCTTTEYLVLNPYCILPKHYYLFDPSFSSMLGCNHGDQVVCIDQPQTVDCSVFHFLMYQMFASNLVLDSYHNFYLQTFNRFGCFHICYVIAFWQLNLNWKCQYQPLMLKCNCHLSSYCSTGSLNDLPHLNSCGHVQFKCHNWFSHQLLNLNLFIHV